MSQADPTAAATTVSATDPSTTIEGGSLGGVPIGSVQVSPKQLNLELAVPTANGPHIQGSIKISVGGIGVPSGQGDQHLHLINSDRSVGVGVSHFIAPDNLQRSGSFGSPSQQSAIKRKFPPQPAGFGSNDDRQLNKLSNTAQITPGPGSYGKLQDFVASKYDRKLDDNGTFLIKDNGHMNQRPQQYAAAKSSRDALFVSGGPTKENPGPGSYETNLSSFVDTNTIRGLKQQNINKSPSPRNQAQKLSPSGNLITAPSMPANTNGGSNAGLLQNPPAHQMHTLNHNQASGGSINAMMMGPEHQNYQSLKGMIQDPQLLAATQQSYDGVLGMQRNRRVILANNHTDNPNIGPGTYETASDFLKKQPKSNIKFGVSKTLRENFFEKKTTQPQVGPGSYEFWMKETGHKVPNPTFPREPQNRSMFKSLPRRGKGTKNNNASIRENFEDYSESESDNDSTSALSVPGPGSYIKDFSTFGKSTTKSESFQFFGSGVERFKHPNGSNSINAFKQVVGPGSYNSIQKPHTLRQAVFQNAGSASFMNSQRKPGEMFENTQQLSIPGPGEYNPIKDGLLDLTNQNQFDVSKVAFKSKIDRFHIPEMKKPDPGKYNVPGAISPNALLKNVPLASYRSGVKRELKFQIDTDVPGIGIYNPQDYVSIGIQKIQGGAPNNFSLLAKKNTMLGVPQTDGGNLDRCIYADTSTPYNVGPGAYGGSKFKHIKEPSPKKDSSGLLGLDKSSQQQPNIFGNEKRFRDSNGEIPGPGAYADINRWHKKTYNLKFLNVA